MFSHCLFSVLLKNLQKDNSKTSNIYEDGNIPTVGFRFAFALPSCLAAKPASIKIATRTYYLTCNSLANTSKIRLYKSQLRTEYYELNKSETEFVILDIDLHQTTVHTGRF